MSDDRTFDDLRNKLFDGIPLNEHHYEGLLDDALREALGDLLDELEGCPVRILVETP